MTHSYKRILSFSMLLSYLCSVAYVLVLLCFLPESDAAKQSGVFVLLDPFVQTVMIAVSVPIGFLGSLVAWVLLRQCNLVPVGIAFLAGATATYVSVHAHLLYSVIGGSLACSLIGVGAWLLQSWKNGRRAHGVDAGSVDD